MEVFFFSSSQRVFKVLLLLLEHFNSPIGINRPVKQQKQVISKEFSSILSAPGGTGSRTGWLKWVNNDLMTKNVGSSFAEELSFFFPFSFLSCYPFLIRFLPVHCGGGFMLLGHWSRWRREGSEGNQVPKPIQDEIDTTFFRWCCPLGHIGWSHTLSATQPHQGV